MGEGPAAYEVRYGWTGPAVRAALLSLFLLGLAFVPGLPVWAATALGAMAAVSFLVIAVPACSRRVALRVGPEGVTLGGTPFGDRTEHLAWSEVASVEVRTERSHRLLRTSYVGVRHRTGSAPPPPPPSDAPGLRELDAYLATQVPTEFTEAFRGTVLSTRATTLWPVDPTRLSTTVRAFAPGTRFFGPGGEAS
ncbi:hypothetical protein HHL19_30380 [Streptomyces sp. R302]|uniref:hypothetical protein n=1 Tax=unclassified Streptomyces TaxID=2593676 RepID=UPI00145EA098|nr:MULTISPECIES: hypothetical protein [unclassified Streptomyces]NML53167.1 hypothetical protein [Streptomyces sp. R301]NML82850.1 hypothetical protein [Streptomyces sp. R302]